MIKLCRNWHKRLSKLCWGAWKSYVSRDDAEYNVGTSDVQTFPFFLTILQATFAHPHASHRSPPIEPQCQKCRSVKSITGAIPTKPMIS